MEVKLPMTKQKLPVRVVTATEAKNRFGEIIKHAYQDAEHLIVQRDGIPVVAILPIADYERLLERQQAPVIPVVPSLQPLVGLNQSELITLAQAIVAPDQQHQLEAALGQNRDPQLPAAERSALDVLLDDLLNMVDQIALLKARALYTLKQR
jgi:prevent-host-death family protein